VWIRTDNGRLVNLDLVTSLKVCEVTERDRESAHAGPFELRAWSMTEAAGHYVITGGTQAECECVRDWLAEEILDAADVRAAVNAKGPNLPPTEGR